MNLGTKIYTWISGKFVGDDEFGNKYYCSSKNFEDFKAKRWVIYNGEIEASKIPPHWHAWLHKSIDAPPIHYKHQYEWQKNHKSNMTGTPKAYHPKSNAQSKTKNSSIKKEYETWNP